MRYWTNIVVLIFAWTAVSCNKMGESSGINSSILDSLEQKASGGGFKPYENNPVIQPGPEGSWDAGALGSMTIVKAGPTFHIFYEASGKRSGKVWDALEYEGRKNIIFNSAISSEL